MDNFKNIVDKSISKHNFKIHSGIEPISGTRAVVYNICRDTNCQFMVKVVHLDDNDEEFRLNDRVYNFMTRENFEREIKNQQCLHIIKLVPEIYDHWVEDNRGYIVMEKMDGTLDNFAGQDIPLNLQRDFINLMNQMIELKIGHADITPSNVAYKKNKIYLIDVDNIEHNTSPKRIIHFFSNMLLELHDNETKSILIDSYIKEMQDRYGKFYEHHMVYQP